MEDNRNLAISLELSITGESENDNTEITAVEKIWKKFVRSAWKMNEYEKNEDVITREESESRVICLEIVLAIICSLIASSFAKLYCQRTSNNVQLIYSPAYVPINKTSSSVTIQNLAMVYNNGTLVQAYFDRNLEVTKLKEIIQLPTAKNYFTMTYKSILSIAYSDATRKITQYHPNLNENGHATVPKSGIDPVFDDWEGYYGVRAVQVGSKFWLLGRKPKLRFESFTTNGIFKPETYIWYQRRQKWIRGPDLPSSFSQDVFCAFALNSSSAMLIGGIEGFENQRLVFVYDFQSMAWFRYPDLMLDDFIIMWYCTATIILDKSSSR